MNTRALLNHLGSITAKHPGSGMCLEAFVKEGRIEEFRVEVFSFLRLGMRFHHIPATHVYLLKRIDYDSWERETIRGG